MNSSIYTVHVLAISGSLRAASSNTTLLRATAAIAPDEVRVELYDGLAAIPPFNPDADSEPAPPAVADLRTRVAGADALIFCTPEYAHGVPGTLKNALDWLVGSGELVDKPLGIINISPRASHAVRSLAETLTVMSGRLVTGASCTLDLSGRARSEGEILADGAVVIALGSVLSTLSAAVRDRGAHLHVEHPASTTEEHPYLSSRHGA